MKCKCKEDSGYTTIKCCNECGYPLEEEPWDLKILSNVEAEVSVKLANIIRFIKEWGVLDEQPDSEYERIEDKTLRYLITAIESKFSR